MSCVKKQLDLKRNSNSKILHFISAAYIDDYLWINALEWNGYYKLDLKSGETEFLGIFDHADIFADKLFCQVLAYEKSVFFVPWFSNYLVRLNTETLEIKYWKLPETIILEKAKFRAAHIYNHKIIMFPMYGINICAFDIETERFSCESNWTNKNKIEKSKGDFIQGCQIDNVLYLPACFNNAFLKYELNGDNHKLIRFPQSEKAIIDVIQFNNKECLILSWKGNVWKYNIIDDKKEIIYEYNGEKEHPYSCIISSSNNLYLIPAKETNIKIIKSGKEENILYPLNWKIQYIDVCIDSLFVGYHKFGNIFLLYSALGNMFLGLDIKNSSLHGRSIYDDSVQHTKVIREYLKARDYNIIIFEKKKMEVEFFVDAVESNLKVQEFLLNRIGIGIWKKLKRG